MSLDYTFFKKLNLKDVTEKTSIKVVDKNDMKWLQDGDDVCAVYSNENDDFTMIIRYGFSNDSTNILDTLALTFQAEYADDNQLYHYMASREQLTDEDIKKWMEERGYVYTDGVISKP